MTEAMPFLQKAILLSYDPDHLGGGFFVCMRTEKVAKRLQSIVKVAKKQIANLCKPHN